mgnify:FL=1
MTKRIEVRILNTDRGVVSGIFDNYDLLDEQLSAYEGKYNIFFTLNDFENDAVNGSMNVLQTHSRKTVADGDITKRDYILIDIDPERPTNTSSKDDEHDRAIEKAKKIKSFLMQEGFQEPILADSGNGAHLLVKVDLTNSREITGMIKEFLGTLASLYDDKESKVDTSTFNPSRITKLYGTMACKGKSTQERPHRKSCIIDDIEGRQLVITPKEVIEAFNKKHGKSMSVQTNKNVSNANKSLNYNQHFNLKAWLDEKKIEYTRIQKIKDGVQYPLKHCLFDTGHDDSQGACIIQFTNGYIIAKCLHAKCGDETKCNWDYIWNKFEPNKPNPNTYLSNGYKKSSKLFNGKKSRSDLVIDLIDSQSIPVFKDEFDSIYIKMDKTYKLGSKDCSEAFQKLIYDEYGVTLGRSQISNVEEGAVVFCDGIRKVVRRYGYHKGVYFFNTMNEDNIVIINKKNDRYIPVVRNVAKHPVPIEFYSTYEDCSCLLPKSDDSGMTLKNYFDKHFTSIPQHERILFDVLTVYRFLNHLQQPLGIIMGRRGSGKTFVCKMLNALIDPTVSPIISKPKGVEDFKVLLGNRDNIIFDNYSDNFNQNVSDVLCLSVTGGSSSNRKLYTNGELVHQNLKCGVYVTALDNPVSKTDLSDRSLFFHLERLSSHDRRDEGDLLKEFSNDLPYMYGHIFHIIANVFNKLESTSMFKGSPIRLTSFYKYGQIIAEELGYDAKSFTEALISNKKDSDEDLANDDDLTVLLIEFCKQLGDYEGTMTDFYSYFEANLRVGQLNLENYVAGVASLSKKINQLDEVLFANGISFERKKSNGVRVVKMKCVRNDDDSTDVGDLTTPVANSYQKINIGEKLYDKRKSNIN